MGFGWEVEAEWGFHWLEGSTVNNLPDTLERKGLLVYRSELFGVPVSNGRTSPRRHPHLFFLCLKIYFYVFIYFCCAGS